MVTQKIILRNNRRVHSKKAIIWNMFEILPEIWKLMNQLMTSIFLLTTNLSWWLMKQEKVLTVLTVSNFIEFDLFRVNS